MTPQTTANTATSAGDTKESIRRELNLKNLRRHDPSISEIIRQTGFVTAYEHKGVAWEKSGVEGPMFLFSRTEKPKHGFFILNRNGLEYVKELLTPDCELRMDGEFILFEPSADAGRATGIWVFDKDERKDLHSRMEEGTRLRANYHDLAFRTMASSTSSSPDPTAAGPSFSTYASRLLNSTFTSAPEADPPLFYSTAEYGVNVRDDHEADDDDDILGASEDEGSSIFHHPSTRGHLEHDSRSATSASRSQVGGGGVASRLWEKPAFSLTRIPGISRGWKAHESVLPPLADVYQEHPAGERHSFDSDEATSRDDDDDEGDHSPPSFLSPVPLPTLSTSTANAPNEPLLQQHQRTLFIYPSTSRGGARSQYQNSNWIAAYGVCVIAAGVMAVRLWWTSNAETPTPTLLPTLPVLSILSLISLLTGLSSLSYLLTIRDAVHHLVGVALVGGPVILVGCGVTAWAGSFGDSGAERDRGWKTGVRWFGIVCFMAAFVLARVGLNRRKGVKRTIKVLELASTIIIAHPPLILLCLALSILSTILTIPFLFVFAGLISDRDYLPSTGWIRTNVIGWGSVLILGVYLWTLAIFRGLQRVTVAGVVGAWYFERHEPSHPSPFEVTKASFARASGPSLGTIIAASFLLAIFETVTLLLRRARAALRSSNLPTLLHPLTYLVPLLSIISSALEVFTGYVLAYTGLSGDDFMTSAKKVRELLGGNGTGLLGDNLLVKTILFVTSLLWGLAAGVIAFFVGSSKLQDARLAPILAVLSFLVPMWTLKLCQGIVGDAADALFLAFNIDLERNTNNCNKAMEAFGEPDSDSLA